MQSALRLLVVLLGLLHGAFAGAETTLTVSAGWGERTRPGRWVPVFLTVSSEQPQNVLAELYVPTDESNAMVIRQAFATGPGPVVYPVYAPLSEGPQNALSVVLRSAETGRTVARQVMDRYDPASPTYAYVPAPVSANETLGGISGRGTSLAQLERQFAGSRLNTGFLPPSRVPAAPIGFDSLDLLILNQPDFNRSSTDRSHLAHPQQKAIVDWVRAGGHLLLWPGEQALPESSPLLEVLPARIGDVRALGLTPEQVASSGLPVRFAEMKSRALTPHEGAETVPLIGDAVGYRSRFGLGSITLLPFDASGLVFLDGDGARQFWKPLLDEVVPVPWVSGEEPSAARRWNDPYVLTAEARRHGALVAAMEHVGNIPGVGRFGFSYVALVLMAMMLVVGPVDWFVLKRLGHQPWTWATTAGWIVLITTGAIYLGHLFKSGDLHLRTLTVTDQAQGATVADTELLGIYSPRTRSYELEVPPNGWWQPTMLPGLPSNRRRETFFHQDYRGNRPLPMRMNVWNLKFLQAETIESGPPLIDAKLTLRIEEPGRRSVLGRPHLVGTITNLGDRPLSDVRGVISNDMSCQLVEGTLGAGETKEVKVPLVNYTPPPAAVDAQFGRQSPARHSFYESIADLAGVRSGRIATLLKSDDSVVCVYARVEDSPPPATLNEPELKQRHERILRAVLPIAREGRQ